MENKEIEFVIDFTDRTIIEANGYYDKVNKIMLDELPGNKDWMIKTNIFISSQFVSSEMVLYLYNDKNVYIIDYNPLVKEHVYYNPDLQFLSVWSQEYGWNIPKPSIDLIRNDRNFWKHFWDTLIIDSDYFDQIYGERETLSSKEIENEDLL